jgi:hypothetical protein
MYKTFASVTLCAGVLVLAACGGGTNPQQRAKLIELCKAGDDKPEACECQVDVMLKDGDPKIIAVMVAMADAQEKVKADPTGADKVLSDAIKAAGFADEAEFGKAMSEVQTRLQPMIDECKK